MKISLVRVPEDGMYWCDHPDCKKLPDLFQERKPWQSGRDLLKAGVTVCKVNCNDPVRTNRIMWYCTDCIDLIYHDVRKTLDKSLWIYH